MVRSVRLQPDLWEPGVTMFDVTYPGRIEPTFAEESHGSIGPAEAGPYSSHP
jgi:hypothetical protein